MLEDILRFKAPLMVQFEITPACNNDCGFCYNFWQYDTSAGLSRRDGVDSARLTDIMGVLLEREVPAVCFTGGEPFLAKESLFGLLEMAHQGGMYASINTNGRLVDKQSAISLRMRGLNSIMVSLHGDSAVLHDNAVGSQGAYQQTLAGIDALVGEGINVTVNYVSSQKNVGSIVKTAGMLADLGVRSMTVTPLLPFPGVKDHQDWAMRKEQFRQYFDALVYAKDKGLKIDSTLPVAPCILLDMFPHDYPHYMDVISPRVCMAGVSFMVVSPKGFNRACIQAPQLDGFGSDVQEDFRRAWDSAGRWSASDLVKDECSQECYAFSSCGGGCRTSSLAVDGSVAGRTMYMGRPLPQDASQCFIKRLEVGIDQDVVSFRKKEGIKRRAESFGGVLADTSHQSFVVLDKEGIRAYDSLPEEFSVAQGNRGVYVLFAAGILEPVCKEGLPFQGREISVIPASRMYPRLAGGLPQDGRVRMLRADTGERIYF
ncbi:MAG: radical SAM protein [Nanoarchaeota archaeon]